MPRIHRTHQTEEAQGIHPDHHPDTGTMPDLGAPVITFDVCQLCGAWQPDTLADPCPGDQHTQG